MSDRPPVPPRILLWIAAAEPSAERAVVESVARGVDLEVRFGSLADVAGTVRSTAPELVAIELGTLPAAGLALIRDLHGRMPHLTLLAVSADSDVALIGTAFEAGASDLISLPLSSSDLHKVLLKLTRHRAPVTATPAISGEILTVYGVRGGLGATTVAVNLAVQLAALRRGRVVLADLDLQRGDVAAFLNLAPPQSLAALTTHGRELDDALLHHVLTRHPSGILVLAAPAQILEADAISHDAVAAALRLLRGHSNYTVIDTPRALTETTLPAFEQADRVLVLTDLSVPGVRAARRIVELLGVLGIRGERVELLVTEAVPGPVALGDAVHAIGRAPLLIVPRDEAAANQAMNTGAPLNGTRPAPLTVTMRTLAETLAGTAPAPKRRGGVLGRWLGRATREDK